MAKYKTTVTTDWPVDETFDYMADLRNFESWDPGVSSATIVQGRPGGPDAAYDVVASRAKLRYEVTEHDAPHTTTVRAKTRFFESIDKITVSATASGSAATYDARLELNGPLSIFDPLLGLAFNRIGERAADGLATALEGQRVRT